MSFRLFSGFHFAGIMAVVATLVGSGTAYAMPPFSIGTSTVNITVVPGMNHTPVNVPITYTPADISLGTLSCVSDAPWVVPSIDAAAAAVRLTFTTSGLITRTNTATITVTGGGTSAQFFVKAVAALANIVALAADPTRPRVYGLQQDGLNAGAVVVFDAMTGTYAGNITVGAKPTDLAVRADGAELLVICSSSRNVYVIDLQKLAVREVIALSAYTDWGPESTGARIAYGPANTFYYVDGAWAPALRVFNRTSSTVVQILTRCGNYDFGFGDIAVSSDGQRLFAWAQYGWSAGNAGSHTARYAVAADGKLTLLQQTPPQYPSGILRDPLNTPALVSQDGSVVVLKQFAFSSGDLAVPLQSVPTPVFAISPGAEILCTATGVYQLSTGNKLLELTVSSTVQAVTYDYSRLVYFNPTTRSLAMVNLTAALGEVVLGLQRAPAEAAIVLPPDKLQWSPVLGVNRYRVYLGTSQAAVSAATPVSSLYLGEANTPSFVLPSVLSAGTTYYWRVDAVTANDVVPGGVFSFTVATIASDTAVIDAATVQVHASYAVPVALTSTTPGQAWSASSPASWVSFSASSGMTPASLVVTLDATKLTPGLNSTTVSITTSHGVFLIPVKLRVDPLSLTLLRSRPGTTKVYGVSEDTTAAAPRAYLLEIDTLGRQVKRVQRVGSSVTDIAVHRADNRVYVTNWKGGSVLAVDMSTFALGRTYNFSPAAPTGYGGGDAYRVSPGAAGRLVVEEEDQWIDVSLFDTTTGTVLGKSFLREGGGGTDPTGRYYYHGDNDISDASLHKFDLAGDKVTDLGEVAVAGISYYGTRTVVVSEDGKRIFWNGAALTDALGVEWLIGDEIFSASADGQYAFSKTRIYDVNRRELVGDMPVSATVSAYNAATHRLVVQNGGTLLFHSLPGAGLLGSELIPTDGAIVLSPPTLQWGALPDVTGYQVYFGTSASAVATATTASPEYRGQVTTGSYAMPSSLAAGTLYYWRVDPVTADGVVKGDVASFAVATIAPSISMINVGTVQADPGYSIGVDLTSATRGLTWTASSPAKWVKFAAASGTTPATLQIALDATGLPAGVQETTITVAAAGGGFTLPVKLRVDPLKLVVMRSDPASAKVYALSEDTTAGSAASRAYLLEIDSEQQRIVRVVPAGSSATDLAVHNGDRRIYVTNWKLGSLLAFDRSTLALVRTYPFTPYSNTGYAEGDVYRIAPGAAGRLVVEAEDQWVRVVLFDTVAGKVLASTSQREGGCGTDPTGRYYYHGDNNSSGASLLKFDLTGDLFTAGGAVRPTNLNSYYGSRTIVVSEDGKRIFWCGVGFGPDLVPVWSTSEEISATSPTGRFAFGSAHIFDTESRQAIFAMPVTTGVCAFNGTTGKLVLQKEQQIKFYAVDPTKPLPTPTLSSTALSATSIALAWQSDALRDGFTLQMRMAGAGIWTDIGGTLAANTMAFTAGSLTAGTTYEFRIKANSALTSSTWTDVLTVSTLPPPVVSSSSSIGTGVSVGGSLTLSASSAGSTSYIWQRTGSYLGSSSGAWTISNLQPSGAGLYAAVTQSQSGAVAGLPVIVGPLTTDKVTGNGTQLGADIVHANGNVYDQVLLQGGAAAITADTGQVTRLSYIDLDNDIVQVEFSGPGSLTLVLDSATGPALPAFYNQTVNYMKGHAGIVIVGADERTNLSVLSVGRGTAVNSALFRSDVTYDGIADLAYVAIGSRNGKFGGLRMANVNFFAAKSLTGVYAPGVQFVGPVYVGNISAFDDAIPVLQVGSVEDARVTGGDLLQANGRAVQVSGLTRLEFAAGTDSHNHTLPAKTNRAVLQANGRDVTTQLVVPPGP